MWNGTTVTMYGYPLEKTLWEKKEKNELDLVDECLKSFTSAAKRTQLNYEFKTEDDGNVQVFVQDLPGVKKEDITLEIVDDQQLLLTAKRGEKVVSLKVIPSKDYDVNTTAAKLELGVLEIRFAKKVVTKKLVEVK